MTAVKRPLSGPTPDAMAKAIARGRAMIPTVIPARRSFLKIEKLYPFLKYWIDLGINSCNFLPKSDDFPPSAANKHPNEDVENACNRSYFPPLTDADITRSKEDWRRAGTIVGEPAKEAAKEG